MSEYKYIIGGCSTGKTRKLLEQAKANNALVICKNPYAMARKAEAYGIFGLKFYGYDEMTTLFHEDMLPEDDFVIDEVAEFLSYFFAGNCLGFTQTEDD
jgi:hypothetical protein